VGRLDGKVALITGGARGQGATEGRLFAAEGATVFLTDVLVDEGAKTAAELGARFRAHDVSSEAEWEAVTEWVIGEAGRVDVLVNNAGIFRLKRMVNTTLELWHQTMDVNATGVFLGMKSVAPHMIEQGGGSIVNISSIAGMQGSWGAFAYGASKWAVRGMSKTAAQELGRHGVRVNSVHPGVIETKMLDEFGDKKEKLVRGVPLGRTAGPEDVAKVVLFLASDDSAYCTGHEFVVDGGLSA